MNYNHDTEQDLCWAADQLRKSRNAGSTLRDVPVRRETSLLVRPAQPPPFGNAGITDPAVSVSSTMGDALSALAVHAHNAEHCKRICESILALLGDRSRLSLHEEFVQLKGVDTVLNVVRRFPSEEATLVVALRVLDKLSRTSARAICAGGGIDAVLERCDRDKQTPQVLEAALRVLLGLTFEPQAKLVLLRRGCRGLAASFVEANASPDASDAEIVAWEDIHTAATRLMQRLADGEKGYSNRWEMGAAKPLAAC
eukprot:gnl/TRDRNA2_/TRDRNA2_64257_c0_seq1.p1 gnl/TRDRNA2_/TRDRNA2_64257_c0~~gnl/TRDRNA2_/TRDRNA2_64257_c0_seq1.p1  ORF type:complete len:255 (-),score=46.48 gnl/TRDRNA2_/TRDRNA2_64257_c0_seq1:69-833(-)